MGFFGFLLLALSAASVSMVEGGIPERAGLADTGTTTWCPECGSKAYASGDTYICEQLHRCRWDEAQGKLVLRE
jgi:hypothetical protein